MQVSFKDYVPVPRPKLKIDEILFKGQQMPLHCRIERKVVFNLMMFLEANGWKVTKVDDGESRDKVANILEAMELCFNLDEAKLILRKTEWDVNGFDKTKRNHVICLVMGNGGDIISDHSYPNPDPDGFNEVMAEFEPSELEF